VALTISGEGQPLFEIGHDIDMRPRHAIHPHGVRDLLLPAAADIGDGQPLIGQRQQIPHGEDATLAAQQRSHEAALVLGRHGAAHVRHLIARFRCDARSSCVSRSRNSSVNAASRSSPHVGGRATALVPCIVAIPFPYLLPLSFSD
jgi:hypothetical protein